MSAVSLGLTMGAMAIGGLLMTAAKYNRYFYRDLDPRTARRLYWASSLIGGVLLEAAVIQYGWQAMLAIGVVCSFSAALWAPWSWKR